MLTDFKTNMNLKLAVLKYEFDKLCPSWSTSKEPKSMVWCETDNNVEAILKYRWSLHKTGEKIVAIWVVKLQIKTKILRTSRKE